MSVPSAYKDFEDFMDQSAMQAVSETNEHSAVAPESLRAEHHRAPDRLVLARGIFTGPSPKISDELYAVVKGGRATRDRLSLHLEKGATAHTNTYFCRFAASCGTRWTVVTEVQTTMTLRVGKHAWVRIVASDIAGHRRIVGSTETTTSGSVTLTAPLDQFVDGGALWLEFDAVGGELAVS